MLDAKGIRCRYEALVSYLDERGRRLFAAAEARAAGRGGIALVSEIKGIAVSDAEMKTLNIKRAEFHGEWNYTLMT